MIFVGIFLKASLLHVVQAELMFTLSLGALRLDMDLACLPRPSSRHYHWFRLKMKGDCMIQELKKTLLFEYFAFIGLGAYFEKGFP